MGDVSWKFWLALCLVVAVPYIAIYWNFFR